MLLKSKKTKKKEKDLVDDLDLEVEKKEDEKTESDKEEDVVMSKSKMILINQLLKNVKENNDKIIKLLSGLDLDGDEARINISQISDSIKAVEDEDDEVEGKVIEGVFDGENMIGPDGKQYSVPANYASKSKLVEGDILKLTITARGTFVYKQIGPIERKRVVGQLIQESDGSFFVTSENKKWSVIAASVTYYKGQVGDEAVILVPKNGDSKWAAVENIVNKNE